MPTDEPQASWNDALNRLEDKLDARLTRIESKLDTLMNTSTADNQRITALEGRMTKLENHPEAQRENVRTWLMVAGIIVSLLVSLIGHVFIH